MYVAAVLGPGVLSLPGLAEQAAGPAALVAWGLLILASWPLAETFARLGARQPGAAGVLDYCRGVFGTRTAVTVGRWFWFVIPIGTPAAALMAGAYLSAATGGGRGEAVALGIGLVVVVAAVNLGGLTSTARVQLALSSMLALFLVVCVLGSLRHARADRLQPFAPHGVSGVVQAVGLLVWSFAGWEAVASLSGSFRRPERDIVRAARTAVVIIGVLYAGVAIAVATVLGTSAGPAPMGALLGHAVGAHAGRVAAAAVSVALTFGVMNVYFAGAARLTRSLVDLGGLPSVVSGARRGAGEHRRPVLVLAGMSVVTISTVEISGVRLGSLVTATGAMLGAVCAACVVAAWVAARRAGRRRAVEACAVLAGLLLVGSCGWFVLIPAAVAAIPLVRRRGAG